MPLYAFCYLSSVQVRMARHHPDLIMCRKQSGIAVGRLCAACDGKCCICDSYVRPEVKVRICDTCDYGQFEGRCIICGGEGVSDAYYCKECVIQEKDRDGKLSIFGLLLYLLMFCHFSSLLCPLYTNMLCLPLYLHVISSSRMSENYKSRSSENRCVL